MAGASIRAVPSYPIKPASATQRRKISVTNVGDQPPKGCTLAQTPVRLV